MRRGEEKKIKRGEEKKTRREGKENEMKRRGNE